MSIIYFSAEGNSRAAARELGRSLGEEVHSILDVTPGNIRFAGNSFGMVFPVYSWGVPPIVREYVRHLNKDFIKDASGVGIWFVITCGDDVAMAPEMLERTLGEIGLKADGGWSLQMPNTYVLLPGFDVDPVKLQNEKLKKSISSIREIGNRIKNGDWEKNYTRGSMPLLKSKIIFPLFERWGIFPSKWHHTDSCVGCGRCAAACPQANITMTDTEGGRRPVWNRDCISCLGCYHVCPAHAVGYGRITDNKGQYLHP